MKKPPNGGFFSFFSFFYFTNLPPLSVQSFSRLLS